MRAVAVGLVLLVRAPDQRLRPRAVLRDVNAWAFSKDDLQAFCDEPKQRSLRITSGWSHDDGVAFQMFDARV